MDIEVVIHKATILERAQQCPTQTLNQGWPWRWAGEVAAQNIIFLRAPKLLFLLR